MRLSALHTHEKGPVFALIGPALQRLFAPKTPVVITEAIENVPDYALDDMSIAGTDLGRAARMHIIERDRARLMAA